MGLCGSQIHVRASRLPQSQCLFAVPGPAAVQEILDDPRLASSLQRSALFYRGSMLSRPF